ncbi:MAG: hypothetical protein ACM3US_10715 [Sphingomonadaceae bacterium]
MGALPRGNVSNRSAIVSGNAYRIVSSYTGSEPSMSRPAVSGGKAALRVLSADRQRCDVAVRDALVRTRPGRWPWWWRLFGW